MARVEVANGPGIPRWAKLALSAALIALIAYRMNWDECLLLLRHASPGVLVAALVVSISAIVLSAYKWRFLVRAVGLKASFKLLVSSYFVGLFFNNFLPSNIGGDVVRVAHLAKEAGDGAAAAASVIAERVIAAASLGLITALVLAFDYAAVDRFALLIGVFSFFCIALVALCIAGDRLEKAVGRFPSRVAEAVGRVLGALPASFEDMRVIGIVLALSLAFHASVIAINALIFQAMGTPVQMIHLLAFVPVISALSMLPLSFNGLGIREFSYVYFFGQVGVSTAQAVAASLVFFVVVTITSLIGGVIFAVKK